MADNREIWACANTLLRIHGREAGAHARARAAALAHAGEARGHRTFTLIAERIAQLEATSSPESPH